MTMQILERDPFKQNFRKFWVGSQAEHLIVTDSAEISERFEAIF